MLLQAGKCKQKEDYKKYLGLTCTKSGVDIGKIVEYVIQTILIFMQR